MSVYRATYRFTMATGEEGNFTLHLLGPDGNALAGSVVAAAAGTLLWQGAAPPADNINQYVPTGVERADEAVGHAVFADRDELDGTGRNVAQVIAAIGHAGTSVDTELPPQCSVAVSTRTALPTRSGRGRFFLPPFAVSTVATGRLASAVRGVVAAAAQGMLDHFFANAFEPVIYHRQTNSTTVIERIDVGDVFDSQRRRRNQLLELRTSLPVS